MEKPLDDNEEQLAVNHARNMFRHRWKEISETLIHMGLDDSSLSDTEKVHRLEVSYYTAYLGGYMDAMKRIIRSPILNQQPDEKPITTEGDREDA